MIPGAVLGWDMGVALARALGTLIAAELLPELEAVMVRKLDEQIGDGHG